MSNTARMGGKIFEGEKNMKNKKKNVGSFATAKLQAKMRSILAVIAIIAAVCLFTACFIFDDNEDETEWSPGDYTLLSLNMWSDGSLTLQKKEQWFKFTATASNQYFHLKYGTIDYGLCIELYDKKGASLAPSKTLYNKQNTSFVVTRGEPHFIKITPVSSSTTGTFKIGFTNTEVSPDTLAAIATAPTLIANEWHDGSFTSADREEWFRFIATSTAPQQYIHFSYGTIGYGVNIQLHDSTGLPVEPEKTLYDKGKTQPTVTVGNIYYIKVTPISSTTTGTYKIAFNTFASAPSLE